MKLKSDIKLSDFIKGIKKCQEDVYFRTTKGDNINLKSELSKFVFMSLATTNYDFISLGEVICDRQEDYACLAEFLEQN